MYGFGTLAVFLLPVLATAAPQAEALEKRGFYDQNHCCTITTKADYPAINPDPYLEVSCKRYGGFYYGAVRDEVNRVWRAECHKAVTPPFGGHEVSLNTINSDCKQGADACQ